MPQMGNDKREVQQWEPDDTPIDQVPEFNQLLSAYNSNHGSFADGTYITMNGNQAYLHDDSGQVLGAAPASRDLFEAIQAMREKED